MTMTMDGRQTLWLTTDGKLQLTTNSRLRNYQTDDNRWQRRRLKIGILQNRRRLYLFPLEWIYIRVRIWFLGDQKWKTTYESLDTSCVIKSPYSLTWWICTVEIVRLNECARDNENSDESNQLPMSRVGFLLGYRWVKVWFMLVQLWSDKRASVES